MLVRKLIKATTRGRDSVLEITEIVLALMVLFAVVYFSFNGVQTFLLKDWSSTPVMYEFISFILLILLGLEIIRLILVHSINVVMELMLLVIARKMLYPDIIPLDLLFCAMAFSLIVGIYYLYEIKPIKGLGNLTT